MYGGIGMPTTTIDIQDAQTRLNELVSLAAAGTEVILTHGNIACAKLVAVPVPPRLRVAGLHAGSIWTSDDFDDPLPEEFWTGTP
jgi:antitoxin (DNA-binding transcriptional repressor) of toxin-antitoxin stability system